jgi:hypothetical protein
VVYFALPGLLEIYIFLSTGLHPVLTDQTLSGHIPHLVAIGYPISRNGYWNDGAIIWKTTIQGQRMSPPLDFENRYSLTRVAIPRIFSGRNLK